MTKPAKAQILIVEDETLLNEAYETVLKFEGYQVYKAFNGEEALEILKDKTPDLILLDLRMPKMDGLTFLAELQKIKHPDYKIIVFSNYDVQKVKPSILGIRRSSNIRSGVLSLSISKASSPLKAL